MAMVCKYLRPGRSSREPYQAEKLHQSLYASCLYASCLSVRIPAPEATEAAQTVTSHVTAWLRDRHYVSSRDIRRQATIALLPIQPDAAYIYQHGRDAL